MLLKQTNLPIKDIASATGLARTTISAINSDGQIRTEARKDNIASRSREHSLRKNRGNKMPRITPEEKERVVDTALANPSYGYTRLSEETGVSRTSVRRILDSDPKTREREVSIHPTAKSKNLREWALNQVREGMGFNEIERKAIKNGQPLSRETVRQWAMENGLHEAEPANRGELIKAFTGDEKWKIIQAKNNLIRTVISRRIASDRNGDFEEILSKARENLFRSLDKFDPEKHDSLDNFIRASVRFSLQQYFSELANQRAAERSFRDWEI